MAAANYMTEADTESIWAAALDTTRFGKIGVRMAEFINFKLYRNSTTQCTNTAVTPLLEEFSEEVLMLLIAAAKLNAVTNPWDFIQVNITAYLIMHYRVWKEEFREIKETLGKQHNIKQTPKLTLPSHSD